MDPKTTQIPLCRCLIERITTAVATYLAIHGLPLLQNSLRVAVKQDDEQRTILVFDPVFAVLAERMLPDATVFVVPLELTENLGWTIGTPMHLLDESISRTRAGSWGPWFDFTTGGMFGNTMHPGGHPLDDAYYRGDTATQR